MKLYKNAEGRVFAYESDGSQDSIIPAGQVPITQEEADTLRRPAPAAPAVPSVVSRFQARAALADAGLLDKVEGMMADASTPVRTRLAWADATEFFRTSPTVLTLGGALGLDDAALDALFTHAATIIA